MILTTAVIKGGTGKTATAAALAQAATFSGKRVLCIDLDPQGNLTAALNADPNSKGAFEVINGASVEECMQLTTQGLYCLAACPDLATLKTTPASAKRLQAALEPVRDAFDMIVIDTPPLLGELTFNALQAADGLIIPLEADTNSLQGLFQIADIARLVMKSNPDLQILGTVITRYDPRPKINRFMLTTIQTRGDEVGAPFLMAIRTGISIREACAMRQSLFEYAPNSKPALDYLELYNKIMEVYEK